MARTIAEIQQSIIDEKDAQSSLSGLTSPSQTAIWRLWTFIIAVCIALHEQLWDVFKADLEVIAAKAVPGNAKWLQAKVLEFQYSATDPQVVEVDPDDFTVSYPTVNTALRIITRCSVKESGQTINIKAAKGTTTLEALTTDEKTALTDYVNDIKIAGQDTRIISQDPDRLMVAGTVYYKGQFIESVVKAAVIGAIDDYLSQFSLDNESFDGTLFLSKLVDAVQQVPGVVDFVITEAKGRASTQALGDVSAISRIYATIAGYIISEDGAGDTLDDTLTMELS